MYNKHKMYKGGLHYSKRSIAMLRYTGLIVPVIVVLYGLLVKLHVFGSTLPFDDKGFFVLSIWWLFLGIFNYIFPSASKLDAIMRLVSYHLLAGGFLVFVAGVSSPLAIFWVLLLAASGLYFPKHGLSLSLLWFVGVAFFDALYWLPYNVGNAAGDLLTLIAVSLSAFVLLSISRVQMSDHEQLRRSRASENLQRDRILTIMNNISDPIISTNGQGIIKQYNAATLGLLDTNASILGKHIENVLKLTTTEGKVVHIETELKRAKSTTVRDDLLYAISEDDSLRLEVRMSPIRSSYSSTKHGETHDGYILILRDVTKAKSLEEERDEFISVVSHELRTPITVAEGAISNVQAMMAHGGATQEMLADSIDMAHTEVVFLSKMVNDLSTLSRAERGIADATETIDLRELGHKMHDTYHDEAKDKGLQLNIDLGATLGSVEASRLYLEEMLQNFITNSIKYTKEGSITLTIKQRAGQAIFAVSDTGIGISKTDQKKVFDKFYRSEDYRTRETSGTGLGLYVTAKLAHKLHTHVELESRLNHGSTFSFKLPVVEAHKEQ